MSFANVLSLKTDERLLSAVRRAAQQRLSADDLMEQRVSFVYSSMSSDKGGVTKEHVRQVILQQGGAPAK